MVKARRTKFKIIKEKLYEQKFVKQILKADNDIEAGKGIKIDLEDLWK